MNPFSTDELLRMQNVQLESMPDLCELFTAGSAVGSLGEPILTHLVSAGSCQCGLDQSSSEEVTLENMDVIKTSGVIRLPFGTEIREYDKIVVTKRFGLEPDGGSANQQYMVTGMPRQSVSGMVADVMKYKPGQYSY